MDAGFRDLDYFLRDHFRQRVIAFLNAKRAQCLLLDG